MMSFRTSLLGGTSKLKYLSYLHKHRPNPNVIICSEYRMYSIINQNKKCSTVGLKNIQHNLSINLRYTSSTDKPEVLSNIDTLTRTQKLKKAVAEYGTTVMVFHISISLVSLGISYLLISTGLDVSKILLTLGLTEWAAKSSVASNAGTFAVAYALHKVFAPVRISITLASVPFIVRYLRKIGFLKK